MPLSKYYGGRGASVMKDMKSRYGEEKGDDVFYATHNKRKRTAKDQADGLRRKKK